MKFYFTFLAFLFLPVVAPFSAFGQERTWKDSTGGYTVQAELLDIVDGKVVLKKQNGNVIRVPLSVLSAEDQEFVRNLDQPNPDPFTAPPIEPSANEASQPPRGDVPLIDAEPVAGDSEPTTHLRVSDRTREIIRFDSTHFSFTDIPPRPKRPRRTSVVDNVSTGITKPEFEAATGSEVSVDITRELKADPSSDLTDAAPVAAPEIGLTIDEVNSLPSQYLLIGKVLFSGDDFLKSRAALDQLGRNWPVTQNETILKLVRKSTSSDDKACRLKSISLLGKNDFEDSLPYLLRLLDDESYNVRWAVLDLIGQTQDPRALSPVIDRFTGSDRAKISSILVNYGSQAEEGLFPFLSNRRADIRMESCLVLGKLGSVESIPKLESLATNDENPIVALQAKSAVRQIKTRLGLD